MSKLRKYTKELRGKLKQSIFRPPQDNKYKIAFFL